MNNIQNRRWGFRLAVLASFAASAPLLATTWTVDVANMMFTPADLTVAPGDVVHWVWGNGTHTVTSGTPCTPDNIYFDHPIDSLHTTFDFTVPSGVSKIPYFCRFHCLVGMTGMITVVLRGDLNCDGLVNAFDIDPFVLCLVSNTPTPPCTECLNADINQDGVVNAFDIDPFVECVINGACP